MSPDFPDGGGDPLQVDGKSFDSVEYLLFESLVHHLIEKGILTKNDALSVVQTVAEVVRGHMHERHRGPDGALPMLERAYSSFEALADRFDGTRLDGLNVHPLRTPIHRDRPRFPSEED